MLVVSVNFAILVERGTFAFSVASAFCLWYYSRLGTQNASTFSKATNLESQNGCTLCPIGHACPRGAAATSGRPQPA